MKKALNYLTKKEQIFAWCFLAVQMLILPLALALGNLLFSNPLTDAQLNFVYFAVNFLCATALFSRFWNRELRIFFGKPLRTVSIAVLGFILYYSAALAVGILITVLDPSFVNANDDSVQQLVQENYVITAIGTVLLVPPVEEFLYRTLIFGSLHKKNRAVGYCISILIFSAIHVVGYIGTTEPMHLLYAFLQYLPASYFLCWAYEKSGTLFAPILMHMLVNFIGISLLR